MFFTMNKISNYKLESRTPNLREINFVFYFKKNEKNSAKKIYIIWFDNNNSSLITYKIELLKVGSNTSSR